MTDSKLNRRNFLKTTAVGAAGLSILANTANAETAIEPTLAPSLSQRQFPAQPQMAVQREGLVSRNADGVQR